MKLSIVTTLYYSAPYVQEFYDRITASAEKITDDHEIIFVNDGSPDESLDIAISLYETDERVRIIDLSRNFGHHKAIMTGLAHARGGFVFLIDCDLEETPELLEIFWSEIIKTKGVDVIYGVQKKRKGSFFKRATGSLFYRLINILSDFKVPENSLTVRLMTKRYVKNLIEHRDHELFLVGLWVLTGFNQKPVALEKHHKGLTTYTLRKKISNFVNAVTSFSNKPLVLIFYWGCLISFIASCYVIYLVARKLFFNLPVPGYTSIIVSIWLLGGFIIVALGIVGIYISRIFTETKRRPYTIVKKIYGHGSKIEKD